MLMTNDGKIDKMITATEMLKARIMQISKMRSDAGKADTTPTLIDIERTHVLFINAHFKPHAAIALDYQKVSPTSGAILGNEVTFSIPQFGDFINDMFVYIKFAPVVYTPTVPAPNQDTFRFCDYPGERILAHNKFTVNGNPLDEYSSEAYNFYREFQVGADKMSGWNRMMGQESPVEGFLQQTATAQQPTSRVKMQVCNGFQTPKGSHDALVLMVPLLYWFCKDPRLSIPSVAIPFGQRFITSRLCTSEELIEKVEGDRSDGSDAGVLPELKIQEIALYVNNLFMNPEIHDIFIKRIGFTLIRVHRIHKVRVDKSEFEILLNTLQWPIESFFMCVKPLVNVTKVPFPNNKSLQNWHKTGIVVTTEEDLDGVASSAVNFSAQAEITSLLAVADVLSTVILQLDAYAAVGATSKAAYDFAAVASAAGALTGATSTTVYDAVQAAYTASTDYTHAVNVGASAKLSVTTEKPVISDISMKIQGVSLTNNMPAMFFNSYVPYNYGASNISTPSSVASYMYTFCLYPGSYQPSGHLNTSRAREFFIIYKSEYLGPNTPADLIIVATAINFLLISDGSAAIRFAT